MRKCKLHDKRERKRASAQVENDEETIISTLLLAGSGSGKKRKEKGAAIKLLEMVRVAQIRTYMNTSWQIMTEILISTRGCF